MSDPNKPNLSQTIGATMRTTLLDKGVPAEDLHDKIRETRRWWFIAVIMLAIALVFLVAGFGVVVKVALETKAVPVVLAIVMAAPAGLFVVLAAFAASQASGEATSAFLDAIIKLRRGVTKGGS